LAPFRHILLAIWIGSKCGSSDTLCDDTHLNWNTQPFTILGITYTANLHDMEEINFDNKLENIEKEILQWSKRQISPLGKITVVKSTYCLSLPIYLVFYLSQVYNG
jgi:hypothetical protein